jgi:hypothetical protein
MWFGMPDLELTQTPGERRRFALAGVGTLRLEGLLRRAATAEADGATWRFARVGFWQTRLRAVDSAGATVGEFEPRGLRRGGTVRWAGRELALRAASNWRERYALADGEAELAVLEAKGWGRRPVQVSVPDLGAVEPGLLLFAVFVVRGLAEDAAGAAAVSTSTTVG